MISTNNDINEADSIGELLSKMDKKVPFTLPADYFETIYSNLHLSLYPSSHTNISPVGYFDSFPQRLMRLINELEEKEGESSLLNSLKGVNVFKVPEGYFAQPVKYTLETRPQAIVKPMFQRRQVWKQAVAAIMTGIIAINALWIFNHSSNDGGMSNTTDAIFSSSIQVSKQYKSEEQINEGISKLSSDDIIKYLTVNGSESDNENIISNIGENDLPQQDPNLSNEKSINNYLNQ